MQPFVAVDHLGQVALLTLIAFTSCRISVLSDPETPPFSYEAEHAACVAQCDANVSCGLTLLPCEVSCTAGLELALGTRCTDAVTALNDCLATLPSCSLSTQCQPASDAYFGCVGMFCGSTHPAPEPVACSIGEPCGLVPCPAGLVCTPVTSAGTNCGDGPCMPTEICLEVEAP